MFVAEKEEQKITLAFTVDCPIEVRYSVLENLPFVAYPEKYFTGLELHGSYGFTGKGDYSRKAIDEFLTFFSSGKFLVLSNKNLKLSSENSNIYNLLQLQQNYQDIPYVHAMHILDELKKKLVPEFGKIRALYTEYVSIFDPNATMSLISTTADRHRIIVWFSFEHSFVLEAKELF